LLLISSICKAVTLFTPNILNQLKSIVFLIEFLKKDFISGGIPKVASRLCEVEELWENDKGGKTKKTLELNSSGQLDLLDEICEDLSKINFNN